jgi:hypothetical protein
MKANQVFGQVLVVSKRTLKDVTRRGDRSGKLSRPSYLLTIKSHHSPEHIAQGGGNYAILNITISKTMADALVQDHGAKWDDTTLSRAV